MRRGQEYSYLAATRAEVTEKTEMPRLLSGAGGTDGGELRSEGEFREAIWSFVGQIGY